MYDSATTVFVFVFQHGYKFVSYSEKLFLGKIFV